MNIRVCHVAEAGGGVQRHLEDIDIYMDSTVENHFIISPLRNSMKSTGKFLSHLNMVRNISPFNDIVSAVRLVKLLKIIQPDIIHAHSAKAGALTRLTYIIHGIPVVYSPHAFAFNNYIRDIKSLVFSLFEKFLSLSGKRIIVSCNSEKDLAKAHKICAKKKLRVVNNGIDVNKYKACYKKIQTEKLNLLFVGRLCRQKNPDVLIQAVSILKKRGIKVKLVLVGDGERTALMKREVTRFGLEEEVALLGYRADVKELVGSCDIILMPSLWEGLPYFLLESLASGKPVVGGNITGIKDVIVDTYNGYLCNPIDPIDIANKIISLSKDLTYGNSVFTNCINTIKDGFIVQGMCLDLKNIYNEVKEESKR